MHHKLFLPLFSLALLLAACGGQTGPEVRNFEGTLSAQYYDLPEGTSSLPNFDELIPDGTIKNPTLDVPKRDFIRGFPGIPQTNEYREYFGVLYEGDFMLLQGGEYGFRLVSDDGSQLYIDGELAINNGGQHEVKSEEEEIFLEAGSHYIRVEYYQGPREEIALQLFVTPPGEEEQIFSIVPSLAQ